MLFTIIAALLVSFILFFILAKIAQVSYNDGFEECCTALGITSFFSALFCIAIKFFLLPSTMNIIGKYGSYILLVISGIICLGCILYEVIGAFQRLHKDLIANNNAAERARKDIAKRYNK